MNIIQILLIVLAVAKADLPVTPPAVIWGVKLPKSPGIFEFVSTRKLVSMLKPFRETHMIIGYFAKDLTAKDFSCMESDCFQFLRQVKRFNYYSQVHRPLAALQHIAPVMWGQKESLLQMECVKHQVHAYNFTSRNLKDHDNFMKAVSNNLATCPLIQIYTAHWEEVWALKRRRDRFYLKGSRHELARDLPAMPPVAGSTVLRHMFAVVSIDKIVVAEEVKNGLVVTYKRTEITINPDTLHFEFADGRNIRNGFQLTISTSMGPIHIAVLHAIGNFRISRIVINETMTFITRDMFFYSKKFSFCCGCFTAYSELGARISFYMFQMDIVLDNRHSALDPDYVTKKCWLCESFLTPELTQGIFTIFILLFILSLGASMLFSIGEQKRFSTPNTPELYVKGYAER